MELENASYLGSKFICPHCKAYSQQAWPSKVKFTGREHYGDSEWKRLTSSYCFACTQETIWYDPSGTHQWMIIWPRQNRVGDPPNPDMPEHVREIFEEARSVASDSPRAATALLRLATEHLILDQAGHTLTLNEGIGKLVQEGRIPARVQRVADYLRLSGNDAVHVVREIQNDDPEGATEILFKFLNTLVDELITGPKQADDLFAQIPERKRAGIEQRDGKAQNNR